MTIYEKLVEARVRFQNMQLKKTGRNKYVGFDYFELADILPAINQISKDLGFICIVSFGQDIASLTVKDVAGEGEVVFTSPMAMDSLKGASPVQNLGSTHTYLRRYLYMAAFEIVEADTADAVYKDDNKKPIKQNTNEKDYQGLKQLLEDYISAGVFDHPENVRMVIEKKDMRMMEQALKSAQGKKKKGGEDGQSLL